MVENWFWQISANCYGIIITLKTGLGKRVVLGVCMVVSGVLRGSEMVTDG